jgi:hypothetical protein
MNGAMAPVEQNSYVLEFFETGRQLYGDSPIDRGRGSASMVGEAPSRLVFLHNT